MWSKKIVRAQWNFLALANTPTRKFTTPNSRSTSSVNVFHRVYRMCVRVFCAVNSLTRHIMFSTASSSHLPMPTPRASFVYHSTSKNTISKFAILIIAGGSWQTVRTKTHWRCMHARVLTPGAARQKLKTYGVRSNYVKFWIGNRDFFFFFLHSLRHFYCTRFRFDVPKDLHIVANVRTQFYLSRSTKKKRSWIRCQALSWNWRRWEMR